MKEKGHAEVEGQDGHTEVEVRSVMSTCLREAPCSRHEKKHSSLSEGDHSGPNVP